MKAPAVIASLLLTAACHTIRPLQPAEVSNARPPERVWVTLADRSTLVFDQPTVSGDILTGLVYGEPAEIPISQATRIMAREPALGRTVALVAASGFVLVGTMLFLESRPDVGNATYCGNQFGAHPQPFTPCCLAQDSVPC